MLSIFYQFLTYFTFLDLDIAELIRVIAENCPDETVAAFIMTYGVFIVAIVLIIVVLVKTIKKMGINKNSSDAEILAFKSEVSTAIKTITASASKTAVDNANVTSEIKNEIRANNDTTMQLLISLCLAMGMNYTDINNTITKAKNIYAASAEQYKALENEVSSKLEEEIKVRAEQEARALEEEKAKAVANAQYKEDLAAIKI